jgi:hypothetical protein
VEALDTGKEQTEKSTPICGYLYFLAHTSLLKGDIEVANIVKLRTAKARPVWGALPAPGSSVRLVSDMAGGSQ